MEIVFEDRGMVIRTGTSTVLVISDIHLGIEEEVSEEKGVHFPYQHPNILARIKTTRDTGGFGRW